MRKRWAALTGMAIAISLAGGGTAGAATVTIGSTLTGPFTLNPAGSVGSDAMVTGPNLVSPVDGTVVNWRTFGFSGGFRLRVIQTSAGNFATGVASAPVVNLTGGTIDTPLSVPIKKGQLVGFDNTSSGDTAGVITPSTTYISSGWAPALQNGGAPQAPAFTGALEFAYNATVRYCQVPKLKGKKLGAAKKALAAAGCSIGSVKKKKGQKGAKFVRSQSVATGTSLADGAAVGVKLGPKKKKK